MQDVLGIVLFFAGAALIIRSNRIAKRMSSAQSRDAENDNLKAISNVKWDSPYMMTIGRIGVIFWGVVLILAAYVTIFGTIDLTQQPGNSNQINSQSATTFQ
jgi:hypothetical protein